MTERQTLQFWLFQEEYKRFKGKLDEDGVKIQDFLRHAVRRYIGLEEPWRGQKA